MWAKAVSTIKDYKLFIIFLVAHLVVWTSLSFVRDLLPTDALETIVWGGLFDWGTHKHPPLSGWMGYFAYNLLGKTDLSLYLLGQACISVGFIYLFKLGRFFLDTKQSMLAVMILEGCYVYSYMTVFDGFNPNFVMFALFPAIAYYFYKSMKENLLIDWILLGITIGLGFLNKYQTIMLILPMTMYLLFVPKGREQFKRPGLYLAGITAFLIFLPHLIWLYKNNFFPLMYFEERRIFYSHAYSGWIKYLQSPFMFLMTQAGAIAGSVIIFFMLRMGNRLPKEESENRNLADIWFLILLGIFPIVLQVLPGLITGDHINGTWGYPMLFMTGILLFYFFPIRSHDKLTTYTLRWVYGTMIVIFLILLTLFCVEKNFRSRYPSEEIASDLEEIWNKKTHAPLKYIGGYIEFALPITIYDETPPEIVLDTYGHKNPWITPEEIKKSGVMIIGRNYGAAKAYTKALVPFLPKNYVARPSEYQFTVLNKLNQEREYHIFYVIIPPSGKKH